MADYSVSVDFKANTGEFSKNVDKCKQSLNGFSQQFSGMTGKLTQGLKIFGIDTGKMFKSVSGVLSKFGIDLTQLAAKLGPKGILVAAITATARALNKLGQEMASARAEIVKGTGATGEALEGLQRSVTNVLSGGVHASIQQLGSMVAEINTRFDATGQQLEKMTVDFDRFANVTGTSVMEAIDGVADVMAKWNINNEDSSKLLDQLTKAGQQSGVKVQTLMQTLKSGRTIFTQFGMSATKSIAFIESMAKAGVNTATAMNGMRFALTKFTNEGRNAQEAFKQVGDAIKNAGSDSEALQIALENFGSKAGAEMINVFRNGAESIEAFEAALREAGGTLEETDKHTRTSKEAWKEFMDSLKAMFGGMGEGINDLLRDLIDSITNIVRFLTPIIQPFADAIGDILKFIGNFVSQLITALRKFIEEYSKIWTVACNVLQSAYKIFHKIFSFLNTLISNFFGFFFAILDGKWGLAWEYAKNAVLKFADVLAYALTEMVKFLTPAINKILEGLNKVVDVWNWVQAKLGNKTDKKFSLVGDVDFSKSFGITKAIEESDKKIAQLSGKAQQKMIGDLGAVQSVSTDMAKEVAKGTASATDAISQWDAKLRQQQIKRLEDEKKNAEIRAQNEGKTEAEIFAIREEYDNKIRKLKEEDLRIEMKEAKAKAGNAEEAAKIETYYLNEIQKLYEKTEEKKARVKSKWDEKLLSQSISMIEAEETAEAKKMAATGKTEAEIFAMRKTYGEKVIELKKKQLEEQRQADLESATNEEEKAKVNLYYQNEITSMVKSETEKRTAIAKEGNKKQLIDLKAFAKGAYAVFSKIGSTCTKIFKGIAKLGGTVFKGVAKSLSSGFSAVRNIFDKLFNLDPTETLTKMLEYEDKVLTFFTSGMDKIPGFVESAFESVSILMDKLVSQIDMEKVGSIIEQIIQSFAKNAPKIISQIVTLFKDIMVSAGRAIIENADIIANALGEIALTILDNLPAILKTLATVILTLVQNIGTFINENADQIVQDLVDLVTGIVEAIIDFVKNGGWRTLLKAIVNIIKAVNKALVDNLPALVDAIIEMLPDLVDALIEIIVDINKSASKIMKPIARLIVKIIHALIDILTNPDVIETSLQALIALIEAVITEIIPELPKIIIQLVKGLVKAFAQINWKQLVKDIFKAFINGIKSLFGIHSPSTLFQSFGKSMVDGLVNGLKGIWSGVKNIFSNLVGSIKNVFSNIGSNISSALGSIGSSISSWVGSIGEKLGGIGSKIADIAGNIGGGIKSVGSKVVSGVKSAGKKVKKFFGFANGTPSAPSGLAVVGERGPELVNFRGGEQVVNNGNAQKMLAGNSTSNAFNIVFNNTSQTTAFTVMREMKKYGRELAFNGVL